MKKKNIPMKDLTLTLIAFLALTMISAANWISSSTLAGKLLVQGVLMFLLLIPIAGLYDSYEE